MYVGILEIEIRILDALTLKDKRRVVKSTMDKVRHKFNVSCGEMDHLDMINLSSLGFACVSNNYTHAENMIDKLEEFLRDDYRFEIIEIRRDII